ncbi:HAD-IB family hydrolase [Propioniciclava tarda]|uniref:HAD-IB family hydrolase n=1 Tax=Propioniciclava tarda TaxID=433330 RepID=A0A4Q9KN42_PROTD|nr:HAD-IB family hydrolase [Propioniciclava tarda]TBT95953.1 HAD-IB family hydrolase [Propioniciclava tarda]SMO41878.1 HAD-superfamily subfamily IB hydrolase, TIGR01490 [Propioniciclava tarda]
MPSSSTPADTPERRRILLTGATGFVGQAVLLALLETSTDVDVVAVVRGKKGEDAAARLAGLLDKPAFSRFVESRGGGSARAEFARRVTVIPADLSGLDADAAAVAQLRDGGRLSAAVHCASAVSFDLAIDEAFDTNVGGALGLYRALAASGQDPHVVHVSTAYVGGSARGLRTEGPLAHRVDWRSEQAWATASRNDAELASRSADALARHLRRAALVHGKEGPNAVAAAAEEARRASVQDGLVEAGRLRAQTLGWTDVYTFTKAMAERVAETEWAGQGHRLSIVRPSIIESSQSWPYPGWIDGYKVADPLIMAYARGMLPEIPALPDSLLDVIPVDMVVGVIVALALGLTERTGTDAYYQVVSGTTNPLPFHTMVDSVHDYFTVNPLTDEKGRPIKVPRWTYRRGHLVEPIIALQESGVRLAEGVATVVPRRNARRWAGTLHKQRTGLTTLRKFVELYKNYTRTELVFDDAHTRALLAELGERAPISFDVASVNWPTYFTDHHLPELVKLTSDYSAKKKADRARRAGVEDLEVTPTAAAVFDLDGTVSSATVVTQFLALQGALRGPLGQGLQAASIAWNSPAYLGADRRARSTFLRTFARRYAGIGVQELSDAVSGRYARWLRKTLRPEALERIEAHRAAGHRTVLVTGVPAPFVAALADLFDEIVATPLESTDGELTGYLGGPPVVDEARAAWLLRYAAEKGLDLAASHGYGDSQADVTWLSLLGHPHAVDPDLGLYAEAKRNRWPILEW